jgi:hypothetical protein
MCRFFSLSSKQRFFRDQFFVWLLLFSVIFVKFDYTKKSQRIERKSLATYPSSVGGFFVAPSSNLQKGRWTKNGKACSCCPSEERKREKKTVSVVVVVKNREVDKQR